MKHTPRKKSRLKIIINGSKIRIPEPFFQTLEPYYNIMFDKTHIIIGDKYNYPIILFPNVVYLEFGRYFNKYLGLLNKNLTTLITGYCFNQIVDLCKGLLPAKMKRLVLGHIYNKPLKLSKNMVHLSIGDVFNHPIKLTKFMKQFKTIGDFNKPLKLSKNQFVFMAGYAFNQTIDLPKCLKHLSLGTKFNRPIMLNSQIMYLEITACYMYNCEVEHLSFELHIKHIHENRHIRIIDNLPNTLKQVYLDFSYGFIPYYNLPNTCVQKCEYLNKHCVGKHGV